MPDSSFFPQKHVDAIETNGKLMLKDNNWNRWRDKTLKDELARIDRWINNEDIYNIDYTDPWNLG